MVLLPKYVLVKLPSLGETENQSDPQVICKFFLVGSKWVWYATEFDGSDLFFGYVAGDFPELGYFRLSELKEVRGLFNLPIERDLYFKPRPLSEVIKLHALEI
ncbi:MAG: DUF2958 domain-containing protein [Candidatus Woykebacteria bacterium]